ncbi:MAG: hypothetical protein FWG36_00060 [Oscillospiraceae bacterium]|nr:hypothetical protein [Oscillospiraceae bacterium]
MRSNRLFKVLKNQKGVSFVFVLGIMLVLMAISVSVLVAASTNSGFFANQREHNQIRILEDSVHKNIMYGLQIGDLGDQIATEIYNAHDINRESELARYGIELEVDLSAADDIRIGRISVEPVKLYFERMAVMIYDAQPAVFDEFNNVLLFEEVPKSATVDATVVVSVEIFVRGNFGTRDKSVYSRATYEYIGGTLEQQPNGVMDFAYEGYERLNGEWRLIKLEKAEA